MTILSVDNLKRYIINIPNSLKYILIYFILLFSLDYYGIMNLYG